MGLKDRLKARIEKTTQSSYKEDSVVKTGFDVLDYRNAKILKDGTPSPGIAIGKYCIIIGKSGSGKSTLGIQMIANIAKSIGEEGLAYHFDFERATPKERIMILSGLTEEEFEDMYEIKNTNISSDSIHDTFVNLKREKAGLDEKNKKIKGFDKTESLMESPWEKGKEIIIPTPCLIDSIVTMYPEELDTEKVNEDKMQANRVAKGNSEFFQKQLAHIYDANIIPIYVNHIRTKIKTGYLPVPALLNYLTVDETIPGGLAQLQFANNIFKLTARTKLERDSGFGVKGFMVEVKLIKSRSSASGHSCMLVFDQVNGFDNLLSNYYLLEELKHITGSGHGYYLKDLPEIKWKRLNFKEVYSKSKKLRKAWRRVLKEALMSLVPDLNDIENDIESRREELLASGEYGADIVTKKKKRIKKENLTNTDKFKRIKKNGKTTYESRKSGKIYSRKGELIES